MNNTYTNQLNVLRDKDLNIAEESQRSKYDQFQQLEEAYETF